MQGDMLHPRQVAERYGITPETLSNWRRERKGPPFIRLGTTKRPRVMYRIEDITEWEFKLITREQK